MKATFAAALSLVLERWRTFAEVERPSVGRYAAELLDRDIGLTVFARMETVWGRKPQLRVERQFLWLLCALAQVQRPLGERMLADAVALPEGPHRGSDRNSTLIADDGTAIPSTMERDFLSWQRDFTLLAAASLQRGTVDELVRKLIGWAASLRDSEPRKELESLVDDLLATANARLASKATA